MRNYIPKTSYFAPSRLEKIAKDVISECKDDRQRALENFEYFKNLVDADPSDQKSKQEMARSLLLAQSANEKVVKLIDLMLKRQENEAVTKEEVMSFEALTNNRNE